MKQPPGGNTFIKFCNNVIQCKITLILYAYPKRRSMSSVSSKNLSCLPIFHSITYLHTIPEYFNPLRCYRLNIRITVRTTFSYLIKETSAIPDPVRPSSGLDRRLAQIQGNLIESGSWHPTRNEEKKDTARKNYRERLCMYRCRNRSPLGGPPCPTGCIGGG
ncbi:hypothetical protein NPIL_608871 [Nephila pilipes]|uniref:Uncharacterized protein n=1 Tax=Nephila pilipes TaxID=299642 RepID=A0A8X6K557_NEPPI|nr:hypothetical protein NPIL_608871 [Nephila pilipes]